MSRFFTDDIGVLWNDGAWMRFLPQTTMDNAEFLNSCVRLLTAIGIALWFYTDNVRWLVLLPMTGVLVTWMLYHEQPHKTAEADDDAVAEGSAACKGDLSLTPTKNNPLMNPPFYKAGCRVETRTSTADPDDPETRDKIDAFTTSGYTDFDDLYQKQTAARTWYTVPNNNQGEFANWLYGVASNCRSGGSQCVYEDVRREARDYVGV